MTANNKLTLTGQGGSYLRVSGDKQEVERQIASIRAIRLRLITA